MKVWLSYSNKHLWGFSCLKKLPCWLVGKVQYIMEGIFCVFASLLKRFLHWITDIKQFLNSLQGRTVHAFAHTSFFLNLDNLWGKYFLKMLYTELGAVVNNVFYKLFWGPEVVNDKAHLTPNVPLCWISSILIRSVMHSVVHPLDYPTAPC